MFAEEREAIELPTRALVKLSASNVVCEHPEEYLIEAPFGGQVFSSAHQNAAQTRSPTIRLHMESLYLIQAR
jgi:hypothetical protein